jgi:hypothetical protein
MPTYTIKTPSGKKLKIRAADEGTAMRGAQEWESANAQKPNTAAKASSEQYSKTDSAVLGGADTASFGFGDEIAGVIGGVVEGVGRPEGFKGAYTRVRDNSRRMLSGAQETNPGSFLAGQVGGGVLTGFAPGAAAIRAPTLGHGLALHKALPTELDRRRAS